MASPLGYLLTSHTYGSWIPGERERIVDREHRAFGSPFVGQDSTLARRRFAGMKHAPVVMSPDQRVAVADALRVVAASRNWRVVEIHVRTNHVHVASRSDAESSRMRGDFKRFSTMRLREEGWDQARPVWSAGGSQRKLGDLNAVGAACRYVRDSQDLQRGPAA